MTIDVENLYAASRDLRDDLIPQVQALIPQASNQVDESQTGTRPATVHRIPWNGQAAGVFYDIHAQVRRYESALTVLLFQKAKYRGGDDENTFDAIGRLPVLIAHAIDKGHEQHGDVTDAARLLGTTWPRECRRVLDQLREDEQPWTTAPGDLRCPYCDGALELAPGWSQAPDSADVWCRRCLDPNGQRYRWSPSVWTGLVLTQPDDDELVTASEAEAALPGLAAATIRQWAARGHITPAGNRGTARLYRLADLRQRVSA